MVNILDTDIKFLQGVGPKRAELLLKELGISTFRDMLYTFPYRYADRSKFYSISEIDSSNVYIQIRGKITKIAIVGEKRGRRLVANFTDGTGYIELVFFQGIKWMQEKLKIGPEYIVFGKPSIFNQGYNLVHPEVDLATSEVPGMAGVMIGIYSSTEKLRGGGIGNKVFSKLQATLLTLVIDKMEETLPEYIISIKQMCSIQYALQNIHFPTDVQALDRAQRRLKFEELFYLQLSLLKQKSIRSRNSSGVLFKKIGNSFNMTYSHLPFPLTGAQKRVLKEIRTDVVSGRQMNRLLQGDVGSGKTLVAILSALMAVDNGYQACIMAPTEVLANQHYNGVYKFIEGTGVKVALLTGNTKTKERKEIHAGLEDGTINIIFGTHALIEDTVQFKNLGLAVIDEQHRFGVDQRSKLWSKSQIAPHILVMTATPIPRTLAMTLYGDLDVSVIDELPPGRKPIKTVHWTENNRGMMYQFLKKEIKAGRQVFIVYPLIKESEKMDYKNLEDGYMAITEEFPAPEYVTAVVHGQQKAENKAYDMDLFAKGRAHILVATSVIEVGVDIPNASVMVIESAERFGLSQLHQLRGRVGRGADNSYCILMTGYKLSSESRQRIELMCSTSDGFELAEADLKMRGPGDFEGTRQSGLAVELHIANLGTDTHILEEARNLGNVILEKDPLLESHENAILERQLGNMRVEMKDYSKIS
ncbi:MAG: ATP-dependent DNA helicase RecG [Bacteroidales bacterium]|nr:ATP-dependent DNA helicase RecG [Bacteroidales bacterium]MDD4670116.1 ATP-dependent DNA helicase RecG [Bacteroidales bacterium]